jgi:hypothetical protein
MYEGSSGEYRCKNCVVKKKKKNNNNNNNNKRKKEKKDAVFYVRNLL